LFIYRKQRGHGYVVRSWEASADGMPSPEVPLQNAKKQKNTEKSMRMTRKSKKEQCKRAGR
jgi:hypothetical protein